jgi:GNAT superfamily N-acetyltransferase
MSDVHDDVGRDEVERRLAAHLQTALGAWPPDGPLQLTTSAARTDPGWDGRLLPVSGLRTPTGTVLSLRPDILAAAPADPDAVAELDRWLPAAAGRPDAHVEEAIYRWSTRPSDFGVAGEWLDRRDPRVPDWLRPFNGGVLIALIDDRYAAGVGIKRHDDFGWEIAIGTDPAHEGKGFGRRLVSQAANWIIDQGAVPVYVHVPSNTASAHVAEASGFPDRGWRLLDLGETAAS